MLGLLLPLGAFADEFDQGMGSLWEVLWHQSGTPTRIVRWENDVRVRIHGVNAAAYKARTMEALHAVTDQARVRLVDVSELPAAEQQANLNIEVVPDTALQDNQPCVTLLNFKTETRIESATVQMRNKDAWRCAYHEAMHVMGVRGHPSGLTVLSYSAGRMDGLLALDKVMLRAWYSPRMRPGMTPFEALPVLADELIATQANKALALKARDRFFTTTVAQMQAYANGQGDVPAVVKRSGKSTADGIHFGRSEMSYFLGVAYLQGATAPRDTMLAVRWLERASAMGNRGAQAQLGAVGQ
ncbi:DUF2927 domain-containing protein [Caenimonas koreensis]|uniref:DUF2927 domain-containing protein n=1 Tax=Caenimonas koreensis TaxID=367474 RepID=UPI00188FFC35|nr:DUF2927 domain-containing protein [Caenimonas koreensis]